MSIRFRLTLAYSALLVVILLVFGGIVASMSYWALLDAVDRTLDETVSEVVQNIEGPRPRFDVEVGEPSLVYYLPDLDIFRTSSVYIQVWNNDGRLTDLSDNLGSYSEPLDGEALHATEETRRNVSVDDTPLRVLTRPIIVAGRILGRIQAAVSLMTVLETQNRVTGIMVASGAVALLLSLVLGSVLLERALRPVEAIATAASQIATGDDLSRRIPYNGPPDELGQLTEIFNATLGRLENLFRAQRRFVADVSHELRTPLTVIRTNADLIRRYGADPDSLQSISNEVNRMARLVGDLLLLAQADAGELPLLDEDIELDTLVLEVYKQAQVLREDGATVALGRFEAVRVNGDPDRLKQLLLNLVGNALKHTPVEGRITLSVWPDGKEARVSVADTGEGIPAEDLPHIFDRFYRVDKARAREQGGAGLGLSIAQWIAEAHGGRIAVESEPGVGTTFTLCLPRPASAPASLREAHRHETRPNLRTLSRRLVGGNGDGGNVNRR